MIRIDSAGQVRDVGPRSAHIAGLTYLAFAEPEELQDARPVLAAPIEGDPPDHLMMENPAGKRFAVTLTDAAMMAGPSSQATMPLETWKTSDSALTS